MTDIEFLRLCAQDTEKVIKWMTPNSQVRFQERAARLRAIADRLEGSGLRSVGVPNGLGGISVMERVASDLPSSAAMALIYERRRQNS